MGEYESRDTVAVSELRQWLYCPRVVWYGRQFGALRPTTAMMKVGIDEEAERRQREVRRTFAGYGLPAVARRSRLPVWSESLGLRGMVDTLLELTPVTLEAACEVPSLDGSQQSFVPVEFKTTMRRDQRYNLTQLTAYALCIEEMTRTPVTFAFLVLLPSEKVARREILPGDRRRIAALVEDVRDGLAATALPEATAHRGRCLACEFRRFCNDVW